MNDKNKYYFELGTHLHNTNAWWSRNDTWKPTHLFSAWGSKSLPEKDMNKTTNTRNTVIPSISSSGGNNNSQFNYHIN